MKIHTFVLGGIVAIMTMFSGSFVFGSSHPEFIFIKEAQNAVVGQTFGVDISIDPASYTIDTARLVLLYPEELLDVIQVRLGPAFMPSPANEIAANQGMIRWGGFTTQGIKASTNFVHVVFRAQQKGNARISIAPESLLLSAGKNYFEDAQQKSEVSVIASTAGDIPPSSEVLTDTTPPSEPVPIFEIVGRDETHVIIDSQFGSTDDLSGIDHYEIMIDGQGFQRVESPYRIYAPLKEIIPIILRVYDRAGNAIDHSSSIALSLDSLARLEKSDVVQETPKDEVYNITPWKQFALAGFIVMLIISGAVVYRFFIKKKK